MIVSTLMNNLQAELFNVWGIDYMGQSWVYLVVDYVSKWAEAMSTKVADSIGAKRMFIDIIFSMIWHTKDGNRWWRVSFHW